jgi:hypothetical protein
MRLLNSADFQSFIEAKQAAAVHFDAEWDVARRSLLRRRMLEAEEVLADQVNFGEVACDSDPELAKSIPILNVPAAAYYRSGELIAVPIGAEQNVHARIERVLRGESIGYNDDLDSAQLPGPVPLPGSLRSNSDPCRNRKQGDAYNSGGVRREVVQRWLLILADLDEVAVGIAHVTAPFPTVIAERLSEEHRSLCAPFLVTLPNVGHAQV